MLVVEEAGGVGGADADAVGAFGFVVEAGEGIELVADELERGVVDAAGAGDEGIGESVGCAGGGGREGAAAVTRESLTDGVRAVDPGGATRVVSFCI